MQELIFALKTSLIISAIHVSLWDGMIFGKLGNYLSLKLSNKRGQYLAKPLYDCIICMASIWGGGIFLFYNGLSFKIIEHILLVAGVNTLITGIIYLTYEREISK